MKKLLIIPILLFALTIQAKDNSLKNFDEIMDAMKGGKTVSAVFHYIDCQLISDNEIEDESVDAVGGMVLDTWEYFAEGSIRNKEAFVVASTSKLIRNPIGDGYVHNYVKVKISASGKVKITAEYVNPKTYEIEMSENFFTTIKNGEEGGAIFFAK